MSRHGHGLMRLIARYEKWVLGCVILIGLLIGFFMYVSTGRDDAHITFFPAYTLAEFGEIQNYNGERMEQSSTLLFVLILAITSKLTGIDVAVLGYYLPILFYIGVIVLTYVLAKRIKPALALPAASIVSVTPYLLYWTFGKMEVTLTTFIFLGVILLYNDYLVTRQLSKSLMFFTFLTTLALALVRPEMPIVLVASIIGIVSILLYRRFIAGVDTDEANGQFLKRSIGLGGIIIMIVAGIFLFRSVYFEALFPQPVYAKVGGIDMDKIRLGFSYLLIPFESISGILLSCVMMGGLFYLPIHVLSSKFKSIQLSIALVFLTVYASYIIVSGGDWMEGGRFDVALYPLIALSTLLMFSLFIEKRSSTGKPQRRLLFIIFMLYAFNLYLNYQFTIDGSTGLPLPTSIKYINDFSDEYNNEELYWFERANRVNSRDIATLYYMDQIVSQLSKEVVDRPLYIMSWQQGIISYNLAKKYKKTIFIYDRAGLVDNSLINCEAAKDLPRARGGLDLDYEKIFSLNYIAECNLFKPDIIFDIENPRILSEHGYTLYYKQDGIMPLPPNTQAREIEATQTIYIRSELLPDNFEPILQEASDFLQTKIR